MRSSALNVSPFDQVIPLRACSVSTRASSLVSQASSSHGSKVKSRFQRTRYSLHWRATFAISTPSKVRGSRQPLTFMATRRTPPRLGSAARAGEGARPPSASAPAAVTPSAAIDGQIFAPVHPALLENIGGRLRLRMQRPVGQHQPGHRIPPCRAPLRQSRRIMSSGLREMFAFPQFLCGVPQRMTPHSHKGSRARPGIGRVQPTWRRRRASERA